MGDQQAGWALSPKERLLLGHGGGSEWVFVWQRGKCMKCQERPKRKPTSVTDAAASSTQKRNQTRNCLFSVPRGLQIPTRFLLRAPTTCPLRPPANKCCPFRAGLPGVKLDVGLLRAMKPTTSNKKLLGTRASLLGARRYYEQGHRYYFGTYFGFLFVSSQETLAHVHMQFRHAGATS